MLWQSLILFCCTVTQPSLACMNPADQWAAGVIWSSGEQENFSLIEQMGTEGTHYLKEVNQDTQVVFKYRSHYDPLHTMVFLGYYRPTYQPAAAPRLAVLLDTSQNKDTYDFASSVRTELDWLNQYSLVVMSAAARQEVEDSLRTAGSGDAQFWTLQHAILPYNSWYEYDTLKGSWSVNAVRTLNGCGLDLAFELPPAELAASAIKNANMIKSGISYIVIQPNPVKDMARVILQQREPSYKISIHEVSGKIIRNVKAQGKSEIIFNTEGLNNGIYLVQVKTIDRIYTQKILLHK